MSSQRSAEEGSVFGYPSFGEYLSPIQRFTDVAHAYSGRRRLPICQEVDSSRAGLAHLCEQVP